MQTRCKLSIATTTATRSRLPRPLTRFVGRQDEIETLSEQLQRPETRLLTLTGPGGIGKTRLSIEVAHRFEEDDSWTVHFVTLASITNVQDAMPAIAEAMGVWDTKNIDLIPRLARSIEGQHTLLVLDNLEQVIEVAADISEVLASCPTLTILATSRVPLHIQGEREYSVPQLTLVDSERLPLLSELRETESIALFVDRAEAVAQDFTLDDTNASAIAQICERLDGLPLAIELAAARTKALPPIALLERLGNQLNLLRSDARDLPHRLQTMRATVEWSYGLLETEEQRVFRLLSVFAGDFPLAGAAAILEQSEDEVIEHVYSLLDKSLILTREPFENQPYYRMLAVVREYGLEQVELAGELDDARLRHAEYLAQVAETSFKGQFSQEQGQVFDYLDRVHENIRLALNWAVESERWELAARIAAHLWQYWDVRGNLAEGRRWLGQVIEHDDIDLPELLPNLYYGFAILAGSRDDAAENVRMAERVIEIAEQTGDRRMLATANDIFGLSPTPTISLQHARDAYEIWLSLDEPVWAGMSAGLTSRWARESGDLEMAEEYASRAYDLLEPSGHTWGFALATMGKARVLQLRGQIDEAAILLREGLQMVSAIGDRIVVFRFLEYMFEIAAHRRQYDCAVRLASTSTRMRDLIGYGLRYPAEEAEIQRLLRHARSALGEQRYSSEWAAGQRLTLDEAISEAMSLDPEEPASDTTPGGPASRLTPREREVLQRIVSGQTDQEIADELFVSYRTVTTHVTNILNKLGAGSRTEAAAIAVRDGLVSS